MAIFIFARTHRKLVDLIWAMMLLSLSGWCLCTGLGYFQTSGEKYLFWIQYNNRFAALAPSFFFHFIVLFCNYQNKKIIVQINYLISICIIVFSYLLPNQWLPGVQSGSYFMFVPTFPGYVYVIYTVFFAFTNIFAYILLIKKSRTSSGIFHNQLRFLHIATICTFITGGSTFPNGYGFEIPWGNYGFILMPLIITYAIVSSRLFDIEVLIKKSLIFAGTFIFAFGVFVAVTLSVSQFIGGGKIISLAISSLIIVIGLRPIEIFLINTTDKFLFQKKYEYKQILKKFIDNVITVLNLDEVVNSTLKLLDESLHPYTASIFILNRIDDKYTLYGSYGLENKDITFTSESKLVYFLKKTHNPAVIKQVDGIKGVNSPISLEMQSLKAVLILPFLLHDDLIGFIALGRKKSDEDYTKDDLDVLLDLARTESIAIGNAQLLTEAAQAERRAAIGTMAAGINHEIGNPLNIMSTKIQLFKMARHKGLLRDKPVEEALDQAETALDECLKQSARISGITQKLSNFAKPSKEFKPQLLNISEEIKETLSVVGYDIDLTKIQIDKNFTPGTLKVLGDRQELQQILFNIIRNAAQAIE
ncbi:MAG: histidine kinase N-terminal 7TM domain-containing protein, partial [Candidatus Omnitrophota bacterium]